MATEKSLSAGPVGRIDARRTAQRVHLDALIVGEGRQPRPLAATSALSSALAFERRAGLLGLGKPEFAGRHDAQPVRRDQLVDLRAPCPGCDWRRRGGVRAAGGASCRVSRCAARRTPGSCRRDRGSRSSARRRAIRSRPRWRRPCFPSAARQASISRGGGAKADMPSPSVPCGGTGSAAASAVAWWHRGLKISSTWSPQR